VCSKDQAKSGGFSLDARASPRTENRCRYLFHAARLKRIYQPWQRRKVPRSSHAKNISASETNGKQKFQGIKLRMILPPEPVAGQGVYETETFSGIFPGAEARCEPLAILHGSG
jgi:hypothetical protein